MNILKKLISFSMSVCILMSASSYVFAAANFDDDGNRDQENGLSEEDYDVIIDNSNPYQELDNPEDAYTEDIEYDEYVRRRDEYNAAVSKLVNIGVWEKNFEAQYSDLILADEFIMSVCRYIEYLPFYDSSKSYDENCKAAYDTMYALGYVDSDIKADSNINYEQALKIFMNAIGYKNIAALKGNDIQLYIQMANSNDIVEKFPEDMKKEMTSSEAVDFIDGTLECSACVLDGDQYIYVNALEYYKDTYTMSGIVNSVSNTTIIGEKAALNSVRIGNEQLQAEQKDLNDYLACCVDVYYRVNDTGDKILLDISYNAKNTVMTVDGYDIDDFSNNKIYYYNDSVSRKSASLDNDCVTVLSGFVRSELTWDDLVNCDYVKLVDNNGDGRYDAVFVYKYDIMLVKRVDAANNKIYGILNNEEQGVIDVDFDSDLVDIVDRLGNPVEEYYIAENSVLSIASDVESTRKKIIVSNLYYTGTVKTISSGEFYYDNTVTFDDRTYTYSTNFDYYKGSRLLKLGEKYTVYLDYRSRIAGYDIDRSDEIQYGFFIKAWLDDVTGGEYSIARIYPYVGEMADFTIAKNAEIDGERYDSANIALSALRTAASSQNGKLDQIDESFTLPSYDNESLVYVRMPVMYKTNESGEITYIDTPYHGEKENRENADVFHDNSMTMYDDFSKRTSSVKPGGMYLRNTMAFNNDNGTSVAVDSNTKVFIVPVSNEVGDINNKDLYRKSNMAYFQDWVYYPQTGTNYTTENRLEAYNVNESRVAEVVVYYTSDIVPEIDKKVPLTVVDSVIEAVDEDGDEVEQLIGWQGNAEMSVNLAKGVSLTRYYNGENGEKIESTVRKGDIIRFVTNAKGELVDYVKVFSLKDEDDPNYVMTGNEYGNDVDPSTLNKTLLAVSDGRYAANGHDTAHVYASAGSYNFGATYRLVYGTLLYRNGNNLVLSTMVDNALGKAASTEIADFSGFNVLCIDEAADRIYVPRVDELLSEMEAGEDASKIIMHTEGGKQRQLIVVKRAK